jgi:hypothetical protein
MKKKKSHPNFAQTLENLRANGYTTVPYAEPEGGILVAKGGLGAVLVGDEEGVAHVVREPGLVYRDELARLVDRGYQKFMKSSQFELPATASQLHQIQAFSESLKQWIGAETLFNESLGSTSNRYQYDRVRGRRSAEPTGATL